MRVSKLLTEFTFWSELSCPNSQSDMSKQHCLKTPCPVCVCVQSVRSAPAVSPPLWQNTAAVSTGWNSSSAPTSPSACQPPCSDSRSPAEGKGQAGYDRLENRDLQPVENCESEPHVFVFWMTNSVLRFIYYFPNFCTRILLYSLLISQNVY